MSEMRGLWRRKIGDEIDTSPRPIRRWALGLIAGLLSPLMISPPLLFAQSSSFTAPRVTQEIRYHMPEAAEVFLRWGVMGWRPLPEELRPSGTLLRDGVMYTPMVREGPVFVAKLEVAPAWIDYGFLITKDLSGEEVDVWDGNDAYLLSADTDQIVEVRPKLKLWVTQEIRYTDSRAGEVLLVWGFNGWKQVPEGRRPEGTRVEDGSMRLPMAREGGVFVARVQAPANSTMNFGFLLTKDQNLADIPSIWEEHPDYLVIKAEDSVAQFSGGGLVERWWWYGIAGIAGGFAPVLIVVRARRRRSKIRYLP